jgi:hypothetical protein
MRSMLSRALNIAKPPPRRPSSHDAQHGTTPKPRVCILADKRGWAYDTCAHNIKQHLAQEFDITLHYANENPAISPADFDLLHICFWGEQNTRGFSPRRTIKLVSSHRWQDDPDLGGPMTPAEFARRRLAGCKTAMGASRRLADLIGPVFPRTFHTPHGVDTARFTPKQGPSQPALVFGWAGNPNDKVKGFFELVQPACGEDFVLRAATGNLRHAEMPEFYRTIDVILVSSTHEGDPLTLTEAMACGCFPVCVDVGIVPELIEHERNGYIVPERSIPAFRAAMRWCENNRERVRAAGRANAALIARERSWAICAQSFAAAYRDTLAFAEQPLLSRLAARVLPAA